MRRRVLIADDDPAVLKTLAQRCRRLGLHVEQATDGFSAGLSLFLTDEEQDLPDLIILDVEMPTDDGLSLCEELRRNGAHTSIPIIVLTGRSDLATRRRCEELGAHYLLKSDSVWVRLEQLIPELVDLETVKERLEIESRDAVKA